MTNDERKILEAELHKLSPPAQDIMKKFFDELDKTKKASPWEILNYSTSTEDLPHEIWRDVVGYERLYHVSNFGRVKSFHNGKTIIRKPALSNGYLKVSLCKDGSIRTHKIHTLVARAFIPNPKDKPFVNHIDADKTNNCVRNLEWTTQTENMQHASRMGLLKHRGLKGSDNPSSKFSDEDIRYIRENCILGSKEFGTEAFAKIFGVHSKTISRIVHGEHYAEVDGEKLDIKHSYKIFSEEEKQWIREHYVKGDSEFGQRALAKKFGVDKTTIKKILN